VGRGLVVAGLLALVLAGSAAATIRPYTVYGVSTREQRSDLVALGFDIGEAA
jgi:hypothetical protein